MSLNSCTARLTLVEGNAATLRDVERLPVAIQQQLLRRLGQGVVSVRRPATLFASDVAAVLTLADSSTVFVKASGSDTFVEDYRIEASVAAHLPAAWALPGCGSGSKTPGGSCCASTRSAGGIRRSRGHLPMFRWCWSRWLSAPGCSPRRR